MINTDNTLKVIEEMSQAGANASLPANITKVDYDKIETLVVIDYAGNTLHMYTSFFSIAFAFTTLLILITYGVFKAFSLIHIKN